MPDIVTDTNISEDAQGNITYTFNGYLFAQGLSIGFQGANKATYTPSYLYEIIWQDPNNLAVKAADLTDVHFLDVFENHFFINVHKLEGIGHAEVDVQVFDQLGNIVASHKLLDELGNSDWVLGPLPPGLTTYHSTFDIVSSLALTTIFTQSIPGNTLGANSTLLIFINADYFNNTGGQTTLRTLYSFGGTILWDDITTGLTSGTTHRAIYMLASLTNENSQSIQRLAGIGGIGERQPGTAGIGQWLTTLGSGNLAIFGGSSTVNTANPQTLLVQFAHNASNASLEVKGSVTVLLLP